jgi:hypothetical protein
MKSIAYRVPVSMTIGNMLRLIGFKVLWQVASKAASCSSLVLSLMLTFGMIGKKITVHGMVSGC